MFDKFERIDLGHFPTRIEYLKNISDMLKGPQIFIKRDDCTGLATAGNKTRKSGSRKWIILEGLAFLCKIYLPVSNTCCLLPVN